MMYNNENFIMNKLKKIPSFYFSVILILFLSCKNENNFVSKNQEEKAQILQSKIDSLFNLKVKPKIIDEYVKLSESEISVSIDTIQPNNNFRFGNLITSEGNQEIELTFLEFMKYDYLNLTFDNRKINGFIPVLLLDKYGNIILYKSIIKYNDNTIDTFLEPKLNLLSLLNKDKINLLRQTKIIRFNKYLKEKDKIDFKAQKKIQEEVTKEANQLRAKQENYYRQKQSSRQEEEKEKQEKAMYTIVENTYGAISKEDYSKADKYIRNNEINLIQNMLESGRIYHLEKGTKCYLSKGGFILVKIRIPNTEIELFVNIESVKK